MEYLQTHTHKFNLNKKKKRFFMPSTPLLEFVNTQGRVRYESYISSRLMTVCGSALLLAFRWLPTLLILSYMGTVIVVLLNILIAQMSHTYEQAKRVARLQYDVDRIMLINRMESLPFFVSRLPIIGRD